jgi:hypothetical protein
MADKSVSVNNSGVSFCSLLTVLFIGLKLTGYIDWSWWLVLAPMWAPVALILGILVLCGIVYGLVQAAK